jgi:hypothetical protein
MRIWSLHPKYLDAKGIVALWRETLLAQKVLQGLTKGYTKHPQLNRFKLSSTSSSSVDSVHLVSAYLSHIHTEATERGYSFNNELIVKQEALPNDYKMDVTKGQVIYEMKHLLTKLKTRDPKKFNRLIHGIDEKEVSEEDQAMEQNRIEDFIQRGIDPHPIFNVVEGDVESWEVIESVTKKKSSTTPKKKKKSTTTTTKKRKGKTAKTDDEDTIDDSTGDTELITPTRTRKKRRVNYAE